MLNVKNKRMNSLKEEIECSKGHLLYLIDVHIFSKVHVIHVFCKLVLETLLLMPPLKGGHQLEHNDPCLAAEDQTGV